VLKTIYILAWGWGILYVLTAIWSFVLAKADFANWLPFVNNIMPIFMGIFTGWFQKWYPKWIAAGKGK